jgi:hypothetical protein
MRTQGGHAVSSCQALVICGGFARFASWFPTDEAVAQFLGYIDQAWGSGGSVPFFAPSLANRPGGQEWWGRFERLGASPGAVCPRANEQPNRYQRYFANDQGADARRAELRLRFRSRARKIAWRLLGSFEVGRGRAEILGFSRQKDPFFRGVGLARSALLYSYRKLTRHRINKVTSSARSA